MRVATFNIHAGVDGWGHPSHAFETARNLKADLLIVPEMWRGDNSSDMFTELCDAMSMHGHFAALARGERLTTGPGRATWQPRLAHLTGERGLYFAEHRTLSAAQRRTREHYGPPETGTWGLAVMTNRPILSAVTHELGRLPRERVGRALLDLTIDDGVLVRILATHGAHLSHGSHRLYQRINRLVGERDPSQPTLLGGDFNAWWPVLRVILPGWQQTVRARTWPAHRPHSQIDHLLVRGHWLVGESAAIDGGSDHRALVAELTPRS